MFDNLKKQLYFYRFDLLYKKGITDGKIVPFDEDFYKQMETTYISCHPVSIDIKYLEPPMPMLGRCYDRSLAMLFCFDGAIRVIADNKNLELRYGKEYAGHSWIEIGDYVYDPPSLSRFDIDLYYEMFAPTNIHKSTLEEYCSCGENKEFYENIKSTTIQDFYPNGRKRTDLIVMMPLLKGIASNSLNEQFQKEVDNWLSLIRYDEQQICDEMNMKIRKMIKEQKPSKLI